MTEPRKLFHRAHYNIIAKVIRDEYTRSPVGINHKLLLSLAAELKSDNPRFDPIKFLDACSPDPDVFPFSELWERGWEG